MKNIPIGKVLQEYGYITEEQVQEALAYQKEHKDRRLGEILISLGYVQEEQVLVALGERLQLDVIDLSRYSVDVEAVSKIPRQLAMKYHILAIAISGNNLTVIVNDPLNFYALEDIRQLTGMHLDIKLSKLAPLMKSLEYYYTEVSAKQAAKQANQSSDENLDELELSDYDIDGDMDSEAPTIRLLNTLIIRAYNINASDIHIEPFEDKTVVRMRVDGTITEYVTLKRTLQASIIARIKIMGGMDIAEKRVPQDGHFKIKLENENVNIRVSVIPTVFGEKAVLRLLSGNTKILHNDTFGMNEHDYAQFAPLLNSPNGILYLTGPTGSGKTTTLYMILAYLSKRSVNISTIEDPVEKNMPKLNQMQVNNTAGLTFEVGLRSLLRQDPDIIMVGETRDSETASISVRAAITGHLVLSTLHTNNAVSSIVRLIDMGIEPYMIANSLVGVVAQRLMRRVCPDCGKVVETTAADRAVLGEDVMYVKQACGCEKCNNTGYVGRIAIHEIAVITKEIRRMITAGASMEEMEDYLIQNQDMHTLKEQGVNLVREGVTTMEELWKVAYYA